MQLGNLSDFFGIFEKILDDEEKIKGDLIILCTLHTSYELKRDAITIKSGIAFIECHPAVKSELFLKKHLFLEELKQKTKNRIIDIR